MKDVVALGELLIDFAPVSIDEWGYPTLKAQPGGAPGNFLAALQEYGCSTALLGKVGDDAFGKLLVRTLQERGIETSGIVADPDVFTTMAFVALDAEGNRSFSFARKPGADTCLRAEELDLELADGCKVFHFGTLSLTNDPARTATVTAVKYAKKQGKLISFDPNLRKPLWPSEAAAKEQIEWGLRKADIVKISDEEIEFLWGLSPEDGAKKLLSEYGVLYSKRAGERRSGFAQWFACGGYDGRGRYFRRQCDEPFSASWKSTRGADTRRAVQCNAVCMLCGKLVYADARRN